MGVGGGCPRSRLVLASFSPPRSRLRVLAGVDFTVISAISNRGDLVGSVVDETTGIQSGLMLDKRGNAHVFDHPDAVSGTSARAINSRGTITGIRDSADPLQILAGFIYSGSSGSG